MKTRHAWRLAAAAAAALTLGLSACGGGGGDEVSRASPDAADETVPASALSTWQTFIDYQQKLNVSDSIEPLKLQQLLPPIDDTIEPVPIG